MKNREKFAEQILDIICAGGDVGVINGVPVKCTDCDACTKCSLLDPRSGCREKLASWANSEYVPLPDIPADTPINTPIWVWNNDKAKPIKAHFAGIKDGKVLTFSFGTTSWTNNNLWEWTYGRLATEDEKCNQTLLRKDFEDEKSKETSN